ncbi:MAG: hypothetical protein ACHQ17_01475, partial [Polyangia bacterium]
WEQLFFPFPIVGAPPQLEQQVQLFLNVFTGAQGGGAVPSAEVAYIATAHLGFVVTFPYQFGFGGQPFGTQDLSLLAQYLVAGSLRYDDMLSIGAEVTFPTAQSGLGSDDYLFGPFAYAAQRLWKHLILELNATALIPIVHGETARQLLFDGMVATLLTSVSFFLPIYLQCEVDTTTYLDGTLALPPGATSTPAETVFIAPEVFIGPIKGLRFAGGVFFNLAGDPIHARTYSLTVAIDIPNRFGY